MKILKLIIIIAVLSLSFSKQLSEERRKETMPYVKMSKLAYCSAKKIKDSSCGSCYELYNLDYEVKKVFEYPRKNSTKSKTPKFRVKMIYAKNKKNETVLIFGGPKSNQIASFMNIYTKLRRRIKQWNNLEIESDFIKIYKYFYPKIRKIIRGSKKVIFVGHSFGGSVAGIAGYQASFSKKKKQIKVFTFGALKIGNKNFWTNLGKRIGRRNVYRIRKKKDLYTLMPRCIYDKSQNKFRCYKQIKDIFQKFPKLRKHFSRKSKVFKFKRISLVKRIQMLKKKMKRLVQKKKNEKDQKKLRRLRKKIFKFKKKILYLQEISKMKKKLGKKRLTKKMKQQIRKKVEKRLKNKNKNKRKNNKSKKQNKKKTTPKKSKKNSKNKNKKQNKVTPKKKNKSSKGNKKKMNNKKKNSQKKKNNNNKKNKKNNIKKKNNKKQKKAKKNNKAKNNKKSSFLELYSSSANSLLRKLHNNKYCINKSKYIECKANPKIHSTFYMLDMENCS